MAGHEWDFLIEIVAILAAAFLFGTIMERFRQSAVLGYIAAGMILGPSALGFVRDVENVHLLAELGVGLVLFTIGLEFSWKELVKLGRTALLGGTLQILLTGGLFFGLALLAVETWREALAVGMIVALSSTVVVLRILKERGDLDASHGKVSLGVLLLQDIALIPITFVFTLISQKEGTLSLSFDFSEFSGTLAAVLLIVSAFLITALVVLPRILSSRAMARNRELPILLAVTVCIGAAWAANNVGISPALGAFVAGILLAETGYSSQLRADVAPLRALFATLFFASIGMLADVQWAASHIGLVLLLAAVVIVGKAAMAAAAARLVGIPTAIAIAAGFSLAQVGELSFVLLQAGIGLDLLGNDTAQALTAATLISLAAAPFMIAGATAAGTRGARRIHKRLRLTSDQSLEPQVMTGLNGHVIVIGFGEAGRSAATALAGSGVPIVVMDTDVRRVHMARSLGYDAFVGDGSQTENLEHAAIERSAGIVAALSDHRNVVSVVSQARRLAPGSPIVARARYHLFHEEVDRAGANAVVDEESETGRLLGEEMAQRLGLIWEHEGG